MSCQDIAHKALSSLKRAIEQLVRSTSSLIKKTASVPIGTFALEAPFFALHIRLGASQKLAPNIPAEIKPENEGQTDVPFFTSDDVLKEAFKMQGSFTASDVGQRMGVHGYDAWGRIAHVLRASVHDGGIIGKGTDPETNDFLFEKNPAYSGAPS